MLDQPQVITANKTRVRINVSRTSAGKYSCEKTIELADLDITDQIDRMKAEDWFRTANEMIESDVRDLEARFRRLGNGGDGA